MSSFSRFHKIALVGLGALGGGVAYYHLNKSDEEKKFSVHNLSRSESQLSHPCQFPTPIKWDKNWDCRDPKEIIKPPKPDDIQDQNRYNTEIENCKGKATRHIILIRHGQYDLSGPTDKERILTQLGRYQADLTGKRLKELGIRWDVLVRSTMTRAQETAKIIAQHLPEDLFIMDCPLLEEGSPIPPEPRVRHWKPQMNQFFQDGPRIEAAFRRYFYRAPPMQTHDSYTLIVCHANVIRYFVCRALQFPPEGWLRISLGHGSMTWLSISPSGRVVLRGLGETGFMEPQCITSK